MKKLLILLLVVFVLFVTGAAIFAIVVVPKLAGDSEPFARAL